MKTLIALAAAVAIGLPAVVVADADDYGQWGSYYSPTYHYYRYPRTVYRYYYDYDYYPSYYSYYYPYYYPNYYYPYYGYGYNRYYSPGIGLSFSFR